MKKFFRILPIFLFLLLTINTVTAIAQPKIYSQGFYSMQDLGLNENVNYTVTNHEPYADGLLIVIDSDKRIQQLLLPLVTL